MTASESTEAPESPAEISSELEYAVKYADGTIESVEFEGFGTKEDTEFFISALSQAVKDGKTVDPGKMEIIERDRITSVSPWRVVK